MFNSPMHQDAPENELEFLLANLCKAVAFYRSVEAAPHEDDGITRNLALRDARQWLKEAAEALSDYLIGEGIVVGDEHA